ncbi:MAG: serine/threonine-protein kinase [Nannocystaceae bacterium]
MLLCCWAWLLAGCGARPGVPVELFELEGKVVALPGRVDALGIEPGQPYRLRADVALPGSMHGEPIDLSIPLLEAPVWVHADGRAAPASRPGPTYRTLGPQRFRIPAEATADGRVELWLDVEHTWAKSGVIPTVPHLVPAGVADPPAEATRWLNIYMAWLALGVLFQVGTACVLVYALDRRRTPYLWFGIQAVFAMTYPAFSSGLLEGSLGTMELPLLDLGLLVGLLVSLRFTHSLFELGDVPRVLDGLLVLAAVASVVLYDPYVGAPIGARTVVVAVGACVVYQVGVIGRVMMTRPDDRLGAGLLGAGWLALAAGSCGDSYSWFFAGELFGGPRPSCMSLAAFAMFLSLVLSRSHITTLARADELNVDLARRIREVETQRAKTSELNEELRAQISERSANLFTALALVESPGSARQVRLAVGTEIDGRYRIEAALGSGAMGMVYEVAHLADGSRWAMKVANEVEGLALARLAREAHLASQLRHEHVVQIRDIGASTLGFMYIVLELVHGDNLGERLRRDGPLPTELALRVLGQVASGLAALHGAGIAHRDLKPANVLVTERDGSLVAKITDFGISRISEPIGRPEPPPRPTGRLLPERGGLADTVTRPVRQPTVPIGMPVVVDDRERTDPHAAGRTNEDSDPDETRTLSADDSPGVRTTGPQPAVPSTPLALTGTGLLVGTPHYIAPELARHGAKVDVRADLFSFGVLAIELLTGERPFDEPVAMRLLRGERIEPASAWSLPPGCERVGPLLRRCLAFDPARRPTAAEVVEGLGGR